MNLKRSIVAIFGPTMSATLQFGIKIGPNLAPQYKQHLKPDDARRGYHEPTMFTKPPSKSEGPQNCGGQGQVVCSINLIAMELEGPAAPGKALKS